MFRNLGSAASFARVSNAVANGSTNINCTAVDLLGTFGGPFDSTMAIAAINALTASQATVLKLQGSNDNTTFTDLANTHQGPPQDNAGAPLLITDAFRPQCRYVRAVVQRATANAVIDGVFMIHYNAHSLPITTQDSTVAIPQTSGSGSQGSGVAGVPVNIVAYPALSAGGA
jgi:hypothetical protein